MKLSSLLVLAWTASALAEDLLFHQGSTFNEYKQALALNYTVHTASQAEWSAMTAADFAKYKAIVIPDANCGSLGDIQFFTDSKAAWSPAVVGNIIVMGTDTTFHATTRPGAVALMQDSIRFAASGPGTGLYFSLSCYYDAVPFSVIEPLAPFGNFTAQGRLSCYDDARVVATSPSFRSITDANLSNWSCSAHALIPYYPTGGAAGFTPVAVLSDAGSAVGAVGVHTFANGARGVPFVIARGAVPVGCGDSVVQTAGGEQCDDGSQNGVAGGLCSSTCQCVHGLDSSGTSCATTSSSTTSSSRLSSVNAAAASVSVTTTTTTTTDLEVSTQYITITSTSNQTDNSSASSASSTPSSTAWWNSTTSAPLSTHPASSLSVSPVSPVPSLTIPFSNTSTIPFSSASSSSLSSTSSWATSSTGPLSTGVSSTAVSSSASYSNASTTWHSSSAPLSTAPTSALSSVSSASSLPTNTSSFSSATPSSISWSSYPYSESGYPTFSSISSLPTSSSVPSSTTTTSSSHNYSFSTSSYSTAWSTSSSPVPTSSWNTSSPTSVSSTTSFNGTSLSTSAASTHSLNSSTTSFLSSTSATLPTSSASSFSNSSSSTVPPVSTTSSSLSSSSTATNATSLSRSTAPCSTSSDPSSATSSATTTTPLPTTIATSSHSVSSTSASAISSTSSSTSQCSQYIGIEIVIVVDIIEVCPQGSHRTITVTSEVETFTESLCITSVPQCPGYGYGCRPQTHTQTVSNSTASPMTATLPVTITSVTTVASLLTPSSSASMPVPTGRFGGFGGFLDWVNRVPQDKTAAAAATAADSANPAKVWTTQVTTVTRSIKHAEVMPTGPRIFERAALPVPTPVAVSEVSAVSDVLVRAPKRDLDNQVPGKRDEPDASEAVVGAASTVALYIAVAVCVALVGM